MTYFEHFNSRAREHYWISFTVAFVVRFWEAIDALIQNAWSAYRWHGVSGTYLAWDGDRLDNYNPDGASAVHHVIVLIVLMTNVFNCTFSANVQLLRPASTSNLWSLRYLTTFRVIRHIVLLDSVSEQATKTFWEEASIIVVIPFFLIGPECSRLNMVSMGCRHSRV